MSWIKAMHCHLYKMKLSHAWGLNIQEAAAVPKGSGKNSIGMKEEKARKYPEYWMKQTLVFWTCLRNKKL